MSDLSIFLTDTWHGFLLLRRRIISNGDAIQGITSCVALYFTYKLFVFTRKKPQIIIEYNDGKWLLKNVGDMILSDCRFMIMEINVSRKIVEGDEDSLGLEIFLEKVSLNRNIRIELGDIGIQQVCEINYMLLYGNKNEGYDVFMQSAELSEMRLQYNKFWEEFDYEKYDQENGNHYDLESINKTNALNKLKEIIYLKIRILGDGYDQTIKYMR